MGPAAFARGGAGVPSRMHKRSDTTEERESRHLTPGHCEPSHTGHDIPSRMYKKSDTTVEREARHFSPGHCEPSHTGHARIRRFGRFQGDDWHPSNRANRGVFVLPQWEGSQRSNPDASKMTRFIFATTLCCKEVIEMARRPSPAAAPA